MSEFIDRYIRDAVAAQSAQLEQACEEAVQSGVAGVLVVAGGTAVPTDLVPYGHIYEFPTHESFLAWVERRDAGD